MEETKNVEEILKDFPSETMTMYRSEIHPADYNPRTISAESKRLLKRSIKNFGVLGGIVVNKQTGYTIVGGHQKVAILDEMRRFPENDYPLKLEVIDVDEKTEKTINVALNNASIAGQWDFNMLAAVVPDIDYKAAGLSEADLSMIGLDHLYKTEVQSNMSDALADLMAPVEEEHRAEMEQRAAERQAIREASKQAEALAQEEMSREDRVQHMKDVKRQVREQAVENAKNMDAYLVLSFDTFNNKAAFMQKYGFSPYDRMIKGEDFDTRAEPIDMDGFEDDEYEE